MKTLELRKSMESISGKSGLRVTACLSLFFFIMLARNSPGSAQSVLFDFDNAPLQTSLPISQTAGGITAHLAATGQGYSIQEANVLGFTPPGFAGYILYPNSIYLSDLLISYDHVLTDFSIMYACQELGCDDAATMRVNAYMNGNFVGTNTKVASFPGTWPVDTLRCSFSQGFDSVVVHYDSPPPTCQDYGVIYLADNMRVTSLYPVTIFNPNLIIEQLIIPNPVSKSTVISFTLLQSANLKIKIFNINGRLIKNVFDGHLDRGKHQVNRIVNDDEIPDGVYFLNLAGDNFSSSCKLVVVK